MHFIIEDPVPSITQGIAEGEKWKMAFGTQRIALFAATGITIAVVVFASIYWGPSLFPGAQAKTGTLVVKVTDAPAPDLIDLNLTITSIQVLNRTEGWVDVPLTNGPAYFDLLQLHNVTRDLGLSSLAAGNYTKIRLEISKANCTFSNGNTTDLNVPPGHTDIQVQFEIKAGETTAVIIDIEVDRVKIAERGKSGQIPNLNPQFKTIVV